MNAESGLEGLSGRVIVITGTARGIGRSLSIAAAAAGMRVVGLDVNADAGEETAELVRKKGADGWFYRCDVSDPTQLEEAFSSIRDTAGAVDVHVNNAALGSHTNPEDITADEWNRVIGVSLTGAVFASQQAGRSMIESGRGGAIVSVTSIAGLAALGRGNFAYSIAKAGIVGMTRELAVEWAGYGIRVNAVAPSQVNTDAFRPLIDNENVAGGGILDAALSGVPLRRLAEVDDIVSPVLFLASDNAAFITGVTLPADGGSMALHPGGSLRPPVSR